MRSFERDGERFTAQGQWLPSPEWQVVRQMFPWRAAVRVLEGELDEFRLLEPRTDLADIALDGQTMTSADAEERLKDHRWEPMPKYLKEEIRREWATE